MLKYRFPCYYFASYIFVSLCHIGAASVHYHDQCLRDRITRLSILYYYYYVYKHFLVRGEMALFYYFTDSTVEDLASLLLIVAIAILLLLILILLEQSHAHKL